MKLPETVGEGRFELGPVVGQGAAGVVSKAKDTQTGEFAAIKLLHPQWLHDAITVQRFLREAEVLGQFSHAHIVAIIDSGTEGRRPWIALEWLEGGTAHDRVRDHGALPLDWVLYLADGLLDALAAIHDAGFVHRDVKPGNLLMDAEGTPKLGDLGILRDADSRLTTSGTGLGTLRYRAPEQEDAHKVDHRADLFGVGTTLFTLSTGMTPPYLLSLPIWESQLEEGTHDIFESLPKQLRELVVTSCRFDPNHRYQSARAMQQAVRAVYQQVLG